MWWTAAYVKERGVVCGAVHGGMKFANVKAFASELMSLAEQHDTDRLLIDHRDTKVDLSTEEISMLPKVMTAQGVDSHHKLAFVFPRTAGQPGELSLFRAASEQQGLQVEFFRAPERAMAWLGEG